MASSSYKVCTVPCCTSTTIKNPNKLFIHVPQSGPLRKKWLQLARRDPSTVSPKSSIYFCEDHFDLPNDMENYMEYHIMGSVSAIRMKPSCVPTKFECQPDRLKRTATTMPRSAVIKRQRASLIEEILAQETCSPSTSSIELQHSNIETGETNSKLVQVTIKSKYRSECLQTTNTGINRATSTITNFTSVATSPIKVETSRGNTSIKRRLFRTEEKNPYDMFSTSTESSPSGSQLKTDSSPSVQSLGLQITSDSDDQNNDVQLEMAKIKEKEEQKKNNQSTLRLIRLRPRFYIGIPKDCYFLVEIIQNKTCIPLEHILLCLKKIRLDTKFTELGNQFGISVSYASKIFKKSVPLIAKALSCFIIKSNKSTIEQNLPIAFRHKYRHINCIIDCLEIEIQKPLKSVYQALTWSEYKKANTIKYLISSTPDGIINYISPGYGGRISDVSLVEDCNFLDQLEPGVFILADRGFKHIEPLLLQKGFNLVRPPSVSANLKLSKAEARKTKEIASLRIHIERVIRLREFSMLKSHSVVNTNLIKFLDDCVVISCALINIQDSIIKNI
ncbi:hypothetical protein HF086_016831 [Spodoptera exigua]|uniref:THAP-type domain-containing protein n=1 Tax=Spodoptera exigua TaxID=7107 RepID=A0A922S7V7_SPOEX|nr:hypothetical protein HF086_016831 [Spodoptera exigua]